MLTLTDYYADWCGPCQAMKPVFEKVKKDYEGKVEIIKVDVDTDQSKSQQAGIMSIPTMVLSKDGKEVDRKVGALHEAVLKQWLDSHL